jgi:hypothetical protein
MLFFHFKVGLLKKIKIIMFLWLMDIKKNMFDE